MSAASRFGALRRDKLGRTDTGRMSRPTHGRTPPIRQIAHSGNARPNDVRRVTNGPVTMTQNPSDNKIFGGLAASAGPSPRLFQEALDVYVVEDDADLRRAILRALRGAGLTARTYDRAADFLDEARELPAGCLVTDLAMPGMDGLELIRRVVAAGLPFNAILITGHADVRTAVDAMKAGASDFIEKPFSAEALLAAIERTRTSQAIPRPREPRVDLGWLAQLTEREREVLQGILHGDTNKTIARRLHISPRTVEAHRASLMRKTGAPTLADLVRRTFIAVAGVADNGGDRAAPLSTPPDT